MDTSHTEYSLRLNKTFFIPNYTINFNTGPGLSNVILFFREEAGCTIRGWIVSYDLVDLITNWSFHICLFNVRRIVFCALSVSVSHP